MSRRYTEAAGSHARGNALPCFGLLPANGTDQRVPPDLIRLEQEAADPINHRRLSIELENSAAIQR